MERTLKSKIFNFLEHLSPKYNLPGILPKNLGLLQSGPVFCYFLFLSSAQKAVDVYLFYSENT